MDELETILHDFTQIFPKLAALQSIGSDRLAPIGQSAGISNRLHRLVEAIGRSAVADPIADFWTADRLWQTQNMASSQSCSRRNSVQNAPIESSTALTGTIFVTISMFMSRANFW